MPYNSQLKIYYYNPQTQTLTDTVRFIPMPMVSIEPEPLYANNTLIGYNYNVTLDGYATALNLNTYTGGELHFADTMHAVQHIRDLFNENNKTLVIKDGSEIVVASGGLLQSLSFSETENNWFNYAKYTAQLSFENLFLGDCSSISLLRCEQLPSGIEKINSPYLMDMKKYKVKSVQDGWSIDATNINNVGLSGLFNDYLSVSYNVQAVGKYIVVNGIPRPAWEQAKRYCINRIHQEIDRLNTITFGKVKSTNPNSMCSQTVSAEGLSGDDLTNLFYLLPSGDYKIYNETLESDISESEGSFSLSYKSILKKYSTDSVFGNVHCIHKITKNRSFSDDGIKKDVKITVNGEIEGLVLGGLFNDPEIIKISDSGQLMEMGESSGTRYQNALDAYHAITAELPDGKGRELLPNIVVSGLEITNRDLSSTATNPNDKPKKLSHTANHNYTNGTISYVEEYSSENMAGQTGATVTNATITKKEDIHYIAEFIVPGRSGGPIVQKFSGKSPKTISIAIDGAVPSGLCCEIFGNNVCESGIRLPPGIPGTGLAGYEITENRYNFNSSDGSFTINRAYIKIG